jgi:hypothetical protein
LIRLGDDLADLVILRRSERRCARSSYWLCQCDCGNQHEVLYGNLATGDIKSCGCLNRETTIRRNLKHGLCPRGKRSKELSAWAAAKRRCYKKNCKDYPNYGGRGIVMCDEWLNSFYAFYQHIGPCPAGLTLDRINNDGNYEPGNVRWATVKEQHANQRRYLKTKATHDSGQDLLLQPVRVRAT